MTDRLNILVVIVHDLGAHLGRYGQMSVCSPNLDRMAASAGVSGKIKEIGLVSSK